MLTANDIITAYSDTPDDMVVMDSSLRAELAGEVESLGGTVFTFARVGGPMLREGDAFILSDGRAISILAAEEELMEVEGDLHRLAYHIGRAGMPCAMEIDRLLVQQDDELRTLIERLGGFVKDVVEIFQPEDESAYATAPSPVDPKNDTAHDDGHNRLQELMQDDADDEDEAHDHHHDHAHDEEGRCIPRLR